MVFEEKIYVDFITRVKGEDIKSIIKFPKELPKAARKFRMELLSIMFGAMQLSRTFGNLLKPMDDAIGLQDYWNAILLENTTDAIDPTIDALETAGEALRFVNTATGGSMGKMFMFGKAVGDTMGAVSQANLFMDGLTIAASAAGGAAGMSATSIAYLGEMIAGIAAPMILFNEDNLKVANAFLSDINTEVEAVVDGYLRQNAAIEVAGKVVIPTLLEIFTTTGDIADKIVIAKKGFEDAKEVIDKYPTIDELKDSVVGTADETNINLNPALAGTQTALDEIEPTALNNVGIAADELKTKQEDLNRVINAMPETKTLTYKFEVGGLIGDLLKWLSTVNVGMTTFSQIWNILRPFLGYGLQAGGIVTRPTTALLGERGPEAVIPLDRIGSIGGINVTINTATIGGNVDMLAREIAEKFSFELSRVRY